jgi:hypothetical protein
MDLGKNRFGNKFRMWWDSCGIGQRVVIRERDLGFLDVGQTWDRGEFEMWTKSGDTQRSMITDRIMLATNRQMHYFPDPSTTVDRPWARSWTRSILTLDWPELPLDLGGSPYPINAPSHRPPSTGVSSILHVYGARNALGQRMRLPADRLTTLGTARELHGHAAVANGELGGGSNVSPCHHICSCVGVGV